jgi:hypothetical protein
VQYQLLHRCHYPKVDPFVPGVVADTVYSGSARTRGRTPAPH